MSSSIQALLVAMSFLWVTLGDSSTHTFSEASALPPGTRQSVRSASLNLRLSNRTPGESDLQKSVYQAVTIEGFGPAGKVSKILAGQPWLEELTLIGIQLTDADVQLIAGLRNLSRLDLRGCQISVRQLQTLQTIQTLRELDLRSTGVSVKRVRELTRKLPQLQIVTDP